MKRRAHLVALLLALAGVPASAQDAELGSGTQGGYYGLNVFGPQGGKCMNACGPGCPPTCEEQAFSMCHPERSNSIVTGTRYTCGTHQSCADHDICLEACKVEAQNPDYGRIDFLFGACEQICHLTAAGEVDVIVGGPEQPDVTLSFGAPGAVASAAIRYGPTSRAIGGWIVGYGPQSSIGVWDYTKEKADSPEVLNGCSTCETCATYTRSDGTTVAACEPNGDACAPCVSCGDVHLTSLDGLHYMFQGAGEFVLFEDVEREIVVQIRTEPWLNAPAVSLNTAVAMKVAGDIVAIHARPDLLLHLNRSAIELHPGEKITLPGGGTIDRDGLRFTVRWPDNTVVQARVSPGQTVNVGAHASAGRAGRMRGLAGNLDGDPENDLQTRGGKQLARRVDEATLYDEFGSSWRIRQDESLFWYAAGETTDTFTLLDFPRQKIRLEDLPAEDLDMAQRACHEQGITHPRLFTDCVYDVAVTRDTSLTSSHWLINLPAASVPADYLASDTSRLIALSAPATAMVESDVLVTWSGEFRIGDFVAIAAPGSEPDTYLSYRVAQSGEAARLAAPGIAGRYEIRYLHGNNIIATRALVVEEATATLSAAESMPSGSKLEVSWTGPNNSQDYIAVSAPESLPGAYLRRQPTGRGSPAQLELPEEPGRYEIRYVQGQSNIVLAAREITVEPVLATISAAQSMPSGSQVEVSWTGPNNRQDYIAVSAMETVPGAYLHRQPIVRGSPLKLHLPEEPGRYEIRYVQGQSKIVLATRGITVESVSATLTAAESMPSGSKLEVSWIGPNNSQDYISASAPEALPGEYLYRQRIVRGSPVQLDLPDEPGSYEIRYVQGQSKNVLAAQEVTVEPVFATLTAAQSMPSGSKLEVSWTGPNNSQDYISVSAPEALPGEYLYRQRIVRDSPVQLDLPEAPGTYEIRYVQGQSKNVLAVREITVEPSPVLQPNDLHHLPSINHAL